jgi:hypothetical protein
MQLSRRGIRALAVDWGPWDGGMVTPELKRNFARQGLTAIPLTLGAEALVDELAAGREVEVVIEGPRPNRGLIHRSFALSGDPWLVDHSIGPKPSVPMAVVLEWIAQVAHEVYPGLYVNVVRDLAVLKGVVVDNDAAGTTLSWLPAAPREGVAALAFQLEGPKGPLGVPVVHYRAVVDLAETRPTPGAFPGSNGLSAGTYSHPIAEAYDKFLFHGPSFRGIDEIVGISEEGIVGWVRSGGPGALGLDGGWQTDPIAIDSALQLVLLWVRDKVGAAALPNIVREYRQYRAFPDRVAVHIQLARINDNRGTFSATLVDDQDNIVAVLDKGEYTADPTLNPAFQAHS